MNKIAYIKNFPPKQLRKWLFFFLNYFKSEERKPSRRDWVAVLGVQFLLPRLSDKGAILVNRALGDSNLCQELC